MARLPDRRAGGRELAPGRPPAALAFRVALVALVAFVGCDKARFPVCSSNADCGARETATESPVCFNLRCVECRYDDDCKGGSVCDEATRCVAIAPVGSEATGPTPWDPGSWDECATACSDPKCLQKCDEKFEK